MRPYGTRKDDSKYVQTNIINSVRVIFFYFFSLYLNQDWQSLRH